MLTMVAPMAAVDGDDCGESFDAVLLGAEWTDAGKCSLDIADHSDSDCVSDEMECALRDHDHLHSHRAPNAEGV